MIKYINGDLIELAKEGRFDVIGHGCNCFCNMGSGIARTIREHFPQAYKADLQTNSGDIQKLGHVSYAVIGDLTVINCYTQFRYGSKKPDVDYGAIRRVMKGINRNFGDKRIGLPLIGCGLAGGEWDKVERIINEELPLADVTIVKFDQR